jgi:hypothetical protein
MKNRWAFEDSMEEGCLQWVIIGEKRSQFIRMSPSTAVPSGVHLTFHYGNTDLPRIG